METIRRIIGSKKAIYAMVPVFANAVSSVAGVDPQAPALLVLDLGFAALLLVQFLLDLRWGSTSDGTGKALGLLLCAFVLSGCAAKIGPGPEGWVGWDVCGWEGGVESQLTIMGGNSWRLGCSPEASP